MTILLFFNVADMLVLVGYQLAAEYVMCATISPHYIGEKHKVKTKLAEYNVAVT